MKLSYLVNFIEEIAAAIDTGNHNDIPVAAIAEHVEQLDVIPFLRDRLGADFIFGLPKEDETELHQQLLNIQGVIAHPRNNGLCLLIILTSCIIVQKDWD